MDLQDKYAELVPRSHRWAASLKIYVKGFPGASDLRAQLMNTKSTDEVRQLLATFETEHGVLDIKKRGAWDKNHFGFCSTLKTKTEQKHSFGNKPKFSKIKEQFRKFLLISRKHFCPDLSLNA